MKKLVWIFLYLFGAAVCGQVAAQSASQPAGQLSPATQSSIDAADQLVLMAWRNDPGLTGLQRHVDVAQHNVKLSHVEWLNMFSFTGNLNEFNINPESDNFNRSAFFPRYNVRVVIPFGSFLSIPYTTRRNRELVLVAESNVAGERQLLKGQVLRAYHNYVMQKRVYEMRVGAALDSQNRLDIGEQNFRSGDISFDEYSIVRNSHGEVQVSLYLAEAAYRNAIVNLEELVGVPLDEYLQQNVR